ncbi:MAG: hypothetical protein HN352_12130 [Bacteroidetes bacterium]|jgi:hypothetical protein|nr:hypothetical protein [Bacteroidota bacterium]MBT3749449.1 hypothetical protein [Bacteroidota bacterium]MBT4401964.1 hypothetical protein [Bacteroidota bacterium]MBT4410432.1 hypothetical protein [Bacteroidota bacterium]MBT7092259.1 hypothetical protein [Bacteroidota bacterium]
MIAVTIGRTFLTAYNAKTEQTMTAKEFFENEFFEYFFNHSKYMQWVTNSPFVQMRSGQKLHRLVPEERRDKLITLHTKISEGDKDASIAIGFPASEIKEFATTSGMVTDIELLLDEEDAYYSWIGGGLGVGVAGGYSIFFDQPDILLKLYEGWKFYRSYLNDKTLDRLRGNQINTWNGQWLNFSYNKYFRENFDFAKLHSTGVFTVNEKVIEVNTIKWSELFFNVSNRFPHHTLSGYVYSLGQTNKTLGFYPFQFDKARSLIQYYITLFGEQAALQDAKQYESIFGMHIKRACELGSIGMQALEPQDLRKYFGKNSNLKLTKPNVKNKQGEGEAEFSIRKDNALKKDYINIVTYRTYKTWLLAMITKNKEESLEYTAEVATALHEYRAGATKLDRKNLIQSELLVAKAKKSFLDALTTIIRDVDKNDLDIFKSLRDRVHMMSAEDFGYFVILLKFDYAYVERNL